MTDRTQGAAQSGTERGSPGTGAASSGTESESPGTDGPDGRIESRLRAVERAVTGSDARPADAAASAEATAERELLESRLDDLEERVAELEAATQAVRGYAGAVRAVNREVERRADLALARASETGRSGVRDDGSGVQDDGGGGLGRAESGEGRADGAVPSESALDAALPDDRSGPGPHTEDREGDDVEGGDDGAWATDALDRLRESL